MMNVTFYFLSYIAKDCTGISFTTFYILLTLPVCASVNIPMALITMLLQRVQHITTPTSLQWLEWKVDMGDVKTRL
jgi:hypothetical protein